MVALGDVIDFLNQIPNPPSLSDLAIPTNQNCLNVFNLLQTGTPLFQNPLANPIQECLNQINTALSIVNGFTPGQPRDDSLSVLNSVSSSLGTDPSDLAGGFAGGFLGHTNFLCAQLASPGFLGGAIACLGIRGAVGSLGSSNNGCLDLDGILGSVLGSGAVSLNGIIEQAQPLLDQVLLGGGEAGVAGIIGGVLSGIGDGNAGPLADLASKILGELNGLNSVENELSQFSFAGGLCNLSNDPCAQAILNATGTASLLNALPDLPRFP